MRKIADQWLRDILLVLYQKSGATRAEIVAQTGLNPASVSQALRLLLRQGTVLKIGDTESSGGRRREVFNLNPEAAYFVAVDLEGESIRFALLNLVADIRYRWEEDLAWGEPFDVDRLFIAIAKLLRNLDAAQRGRVLAAGISYPGLLDEEGRLTAVNLAWEKLPLLSELKAKAQQYDMSDLSFFLEPDRHSAVLAERWLGSARGCDNGLLLFSERGIGIGMFVDGRPVKGSQNMAGEIGHMTLDPGSRDVCRCGKRGCVETLASSPHIIRRYMERTGHTGTLRITEVFEKARQKDAAAMAVLEEAGQALGRALSYAINLLNPKIVILAGDLAIGEDVLLPSIEREIRKQTLPELASELTITVSSLGLDMRLKGAGALAFRKSVSELPLLKRMCYPVVGRRSANAPSLMRSAG